MLTEADTIPSMIARRDDQYEIDTDPERLDVDRLHRWLSTDAYWARGRSRATVEQAIRGSLNFGVHHPEHGQVGYARVVTDLATFAWWCDVYIDRAHRGAGLGTWLVTTVRDHLTPYSLSRTILGTADAHALYAKVGFAPYPRPDQLMMLHSEG